MFLKWMQISECILVKSNTYQRVIGIIKLAKVCRVHMLARYFEINKFQVKLPIHTHNSKFQRHISLSKAMQRFAK